jgi:PAS domain S-box-containing protein
MGRRIDRIAASKNAEDKSPLANLVHEGLDRLSQGIAILDSELRLVLANQRLVDMFGTPPELVEPGTPFADMIRFNAERGNYGPGEVEELVRDRVERARSFEPHLFERARADGTAIEVRGEPLPGGGFVSTFTDITERKLAEEVLRKDRERIEVDVFERTSDLPQTIDELRQTESALLESEERYRDLVENDTALIIRFWPDTTNTFANEAYARNRNTTPEDLIGRKFIDRLPDEEKDTYPAHLNTLTAEHPVKTREMRIVRPDGSFGWLSWSIRAFHNDQGNITEIQSARVDASDQKRAEQALKESEEKFRTAFESAAVGMAMVGNDGGWLIVNRAFCEMVGYSE